MADKDYDGDGEVESGTDEYRGVIHNKIQQKMEVRKVMVRILQV